MRILLVDEGVDRDGGLARLAIADDQFALATADRHHGVNRLHTRLQGLVNRLTRNNARRHFLDDVGGFGINGTFAVDWRAQCVNYAATQFGADRHFQNTTGCFYRIAFGNTSVITQNNGTDRIALKVKRQAKYIVGKFKHFTLHYIGQTVNAGDTVGHGYDRALRTYVSRRAQAFDTAFEQLADL